MFQCAKECGLALSAQSPKVVVARSIPTAGNKVGRGKTAPFLWQKSAIGLDRYISCSSKGSRFQTKSIHSNRTRNSLCSQCADADESASALKGFTKDLDMVRTQTFLILNNKTDGN